MRQLNQGRFKIEFAKPLTASNAPKTKTPESILTNAINEGVIASPISLGGKARLTKLLGSFSKTGDKINSLEEMGIDVFVSTDDKGFGFYDPEFAKIQFRAHFQYSPERRPQITLPNYALRMPGYADRMLEQICKDQQNLRILFRHGLSKSPYPPEGIRGFDQLSYTRDLSKPKTAIGRFLRNSQNLFDGKSDQKINFVIDDAKIDAINPKFKAMAEDHSVYLRSSIIEENFDISVVAHEAGHAARRLNCKLFQKCAPTIRFYSSFDFGPEGYERGFSADEWEAHKISQLYGNGSEKIISEKVIKFSVIQTDLLQKAILVLESETEKLHKAKATDLVTAEGIQFLRIRVANAKAQDAFTLVELPSSLKVEEYFDFGKRMLKERLEQLSHTQ